MLIRSCHTRLRFAFALVIASVGLGVPSVSVAQRISARGSITCALGARGAFCWGRTGALGYRVATRVARDAVAIASSSTHVCALAQNNQLTCAPHPTVAASSTAQTRPDGTPALLMDFETASSSSVFRTPSVRAVVAGDAHVCALNTNGTVLCAGSHSAGQLGIGSAATTGAFQAVPGLTAVEQLVAGSDFTCARKRDRSVWCWGDNSRGQQGATSRTGRTRPARVSELQSVDDLAAAESALCAIIASSVQCLGYRADAVGNTRPTSDRPGRPALPWAPQTFSRAVRIFGGASMMCGLTPTNGVACSGFNRTIAAGAGDYDLRFATGAMPFGPSAEVSINNDSICALSADQTVACVGNDAYGAVGSQQATRFAAPTRVAGLAPSSRIVTAGYHNCSISATGTVDCWGVDHPLDMLGGTTSDNAMLGLRDTPTPLAGITDATEVALNGGTTLVRHRDGALSIISAGPFAELGVALNSSTYRVPAAPDRSAYAMGGSELCSLRNSQVECATAGRIVPLNAASGTNSSWRAPVLLTGAMGPVTSLSASLVAACATLATGTSGSVACWGNNSSDLVTAGRPVRAAGATNLIEGLRDRSDVRVSYGRGTGLGCALSRGQIECWGSGSLAFSLRPGASVRPTREVLLEQPVRSFCVGPRHGCAVTDTGVQCFGANDRGQLGITPSTTAYQTSTLSLANAVEVSCGLDHSCARTRDGAVHCWGDTVDGAIGNGQSRLIRTPVTVSPAS